MPGVMVSSWSHFVRSHLRRALSKFARPPKLLATTPDAKESSESNLAHLRLHHDRLIAARFQL